MLDNPGVRSQHLRTHGIENAKPFHVIALPEEIPRVEALIRSLGFEPPGNWTTTEFAPQQIQLVVNTHVGVPYFRAVAKVAFIICSRCFLS